MSPTAWLVVLTTHQEVPLSSGQVHRLIWGAQGMLRVFLCILGRDLTLAMRRRTDVLTTLFFFVIVVSLFPLGIGPEMNTLRLIAPGVVWVAALLASMLALERLFAADHEDGTLEQMLLAPQPLFILVLGKVAAHWQPPGTAAGADGAVVGPAVRPLHRCAQNTALFAVAGYTGAEPDRGHWDGFNSGLRGGVSCCC